MQNTDIEISPVQSNRNTDPHCFIAVNGFVFLATFKSDFGPVLTRFVNGNGLGMLEEVNGQKVWSKWSGDIALEDGEFAAYEEAANHVPTELQNPTATESQNFLAALDAYTPEPVDAYRTPEQKKLIAMDDEFLEVESNHSREAMNERMRRNAERPTQLPNYLCIGAEVVVGANSDKPFRGFIFTAPVEEGGLDFNVGVFNDTPEGDYFCTVKWATVAQLTPTGGMADFNFRD